MKFFYSIFIILLLQFNFNIHAQSFKSIKQSSISLPDSFYIGELSYLDIDYNNLLITDRLLRQVVIYNFEENELINLNPSECYPGFKFYPIEAHYGDTNEIFISNTGVWGFRFKKDGSCVGAANEKFSAPQKFHYSEKLIGLTNDQEKSFVTGWDSTGKPLNYFFEIPNKFKEAEYRISLGGVVKDGNSIYAVNSMEPKIYKYEIDTKNTITSKFSHDTYSELESDLSGNINDVNFMKEAQEIFNTNSLNYKLFSLNKSYLALIVRKAVKEELRYDYYCYIISKENLKLVDYLKSEYEIVLVENNILVYLKRIPIADEEEKVELIFNEIKVEY